MVDDVTFLASVAAVYFLLAVSPGPNFLLITHAAASQSRRTAFFICFGVSSASVIWAALAAAGLGLVIQRFEGLYRLLQVVGGLYLIYLAWSMFRASPSNTAAVHVNVPDTAWHAYRRGLMTNIGNPKSLAFFGSAFASLFAADQPVGVQMLAVLVVAVISLAGNLVVLLMFSRPAVRVAYRGMKTLIDRVAGALLGVFGARLLLDR